MRTTAVLGCISMYSSSSLFLLEKMCALKHYHVGFESLKTHFVRYFGVASLSIAGLNTVTVQKEFGASPDSLFKLVALITGLVSVM